jgi:transposase
MTSFTRFDLTEQEYASLEAFLPLERSGQSGRPFRSHRQILNGILWIHRSGAPWRDLPDHYGPWTTVYGRFRRWCQEGLWATILNRLHARGRRLGRIDFEFAAVDGSVVSAHKAAAGALRSFPGRPLTHEESLEKQALGFSRGGFSTKIHVLCEGPGKPISLTLTPGQAHENTQLDPLLDQVAIGGLPGRARQRFDCLAGDKGYDGRTTRSKLRQRGIEPIIAHRKLPNGQYPPQAADFDKARYRQRNVVERLIGRLKEFRRIATRFEKLGDHFIAMVQIGFIRIWLKDLLSYTA